MKWLPYLLALAGVPAAVAGPAADLAARILNAGLDREECYRVRDISLIRDDVRLFFTDGLLIFGKPVDGSPVTAVFSAADVESGDAEVMLFPPTRSERASLAAFTGAPNLNEHIRYAVLVFTDNSYARLMEQIKKRGAAKSPEMGAALSDTFDSVIRNFASSFQIRLVNDILSGRPAARGFLYSTLNSPRLGNFDVFYDPSASEQITVGALATRNNGIFFDVWTRFANRAARLSGGAAPSPEIALKDFRIDATLEKDLKMKVVTRVRVIPGPGATRSLPFDLSRRMRVTEAFIDGKPAEIFQPESLRANLIRGSASDIFLLVPPDPLTAGREYDVEFHHEGEVITDSGNGVFFVGARGSWYPNVNLQFARYDMTFHYPRELDLVATGEVVSDRTDAAAHITRRRAETPVRMAGFNLGNYERQTASRAGITIEVYANRRLERALERSTQTVAVAPVQPRAGLPQFGGVRPGELILVPVDTPFADPTARLQQMAVEVASAIEFMAARFGPPPLKTVTVAPIPGTFGQGFPGLIYLSTLSYLEPGARPVNARSVSQQIFYSELLAAHEAAHQWWGNVVTSAGFQDEWLMEALADYTALLYLERKKGPHALETVLADYRSRLLAKKEGGGTIESVGPIVWGLRLTNSQAPNAWNVITYEKGAWIIHMLRRRMGDQRFMAMLGELRRRYEFKGISTDQFRQLAAQYLPPKSQDPQLETFFEQWVYGTGVPTLKLNYSVRGKAPAIRITGSVSQADVDDDFAALVPVEIQAGNSRSVLWVRTGGENTFSLNLKQGPVKLALDPGESVLAVHK